MCQRDPDKGWKQWSRKRKEKQILCRVHHTCWLFHSLSPRHWWSIGTHDSSVGSILLECPNRSKLRVTGSITARTVDFCRSSHIQKLNKSLSQYSSGLRNSHTKTTHIKTYFFPSKITDSFSCSSLWVSAFDQRPHLLAALTMHITIVIVPVRKALQRVRTREKSGQITAT